MRKPQEPDPKPTNSKSPFSLSYQERIHYKVLIGSPGNFTSMLNYGANYSAAHGDTMLLYVHKSSLHYDTTSGKFQDASNTTIRISCTTCLAVLYAPSAGDIHHPSVVDALLHR